MKQKQSGATRFLPLLLVVLVLCLIAFIAWRYFDTKANKGQPTQQTQANNDNKQENALEIKELGVRVMPPDNIPNLTYAFRTGRTTDGKTMLTADLSTKEIEEIDSNCSAEEAPLGWLIRIDGQYPKNANVENSGGLLVKQFDTFHVDYSGPQAVCTEDPELQTTISSLLKNLSEKSWIIEEL